MTKSLPILCCRGRLLLFLAVLGRDGRSLLLALLALGGTRKTLDARAKIERMALRSATDR